MMNLHDESSWKHDRSICSCGANITEYEPDIILGMEFLSNHDATINLRTKTLDLQGQIYELETSDNQQTEEMKLEEKTKIYLHTESQPESITNLLRQNDTEIQNIGLLPDVTHNIQLKKNEVISMKPFRIHLTIKGKVNSEIEKLLRDGIIQKSQSSYASAAFPMLKKNGDIRLVVDYRALNQITLEYYYVFPKII
ncbi:Retrovirus-related Pol polyprotein from transposon gypsy [Dictyocoela muelleri]|nr:Retrovirus-related Pol polyprotein from transposon gypsy [Dictyocoela muelleri]